MTTLEMCNSCIHCSYCMAAYKKDHWCGNHTKPKTYKQYQIKEETSYEIKEKPTGNPDF